MPAEADERLDAQCLALLPEFPPGKAPLVIPERIESAREHAAGNGRAGPLKERQLERVDVGGGRSPWRKRGRPLLFRPSTFLRRNVRDFPLRLRCL